MMDLLSKLASSWRRTAKHSSTLGETGEAQAIAIIMRADELAALRPVIEKLVEAGQALNDWAELNKNGVIEREGWRAALESWRRMNG